MCYAIGEERRAKRNIRIQAEIEQKQEKLYNREMQNSGAEIQFPPEIERTNNRKIIEELEKQIATQEQERVMQQAELEELENSLKGAGNDLEGTNKEEVQKQIDKSQQMILSIEQVIQALKEAKDAFVLAEKEHTESRRVFARSKWQKSIALQLYNLYRTRDEIQEKIQKIDTEMKSQWWFQRWFMARYGELKKEHEMLSQKDQQLLKQIRHLEDKSVMAEEFLWKWERKDAGLKSKIKDKGTKEPEGISQWEEDKLVQFETEIETFMQGEEEPDHKIEKLMKVWIKFWGESKLSCDGLKEAGKIAIRTLLSLFRENGQDVDSQIDQGMKKIDEFMDSVVPKGDVIGNLICWDVAKYFWGKVLDPVIQGKKELKAKIQAIKDAKTKQFGEEICLDTQYMLKKAGAVIMDELVSKRAPAKQRLEKAIDTYQNSEIKKKLDEASQTKQRLMRKSLENFKDQKVKMMLEMANIEFWELYQDERLRQMRDEIRQAKREYFKSSMENGNELKALLSNVRAMGAPNKKDRFVPESGNSVEKEIEALNAAINYYPTDWVEESDKDQIEVKSTDRSYYGIGENVIAINRGTEEKSIERAIHELGHRFEHYKEEILVNEWIFFEERKMKFGNKKIDLSVGIDRETAIEGGFLNKYIGKIYRMGKAPYASAYEIVSMGFQYAYTNPTFLWQDEDYAQLIYGILALC